MSVSPRGGTVLIVVAGISALFLTLSLAFLSRMRGDAEESRMIVQEAQARIMLNAGLHYLQEASRLGWDDPATPEHEESYGWVDVRDGLPGPRDRTGRELASLTGGVFPAPGTAARCPMFMMERPPFALKTNQAYNPVRGDAGLGWAARISYVAPDPQPAATTWTEFRDGNPKPRGDSLGMAWFRVFREQDDLTTPQDERLSTFVITCGAGATDGFRDWADVSAESAQGRFNNDPQFFNALRQQERLLHFRVEWHPSVGGAGSVAVAPDSYAQVPMNDTDDGWWSVRSFAGSFLYIQRLDQPPAGGKW
jgi:hypothetical protein